MTTTRVPDSPDKAVRDVRFDGKYAVSRPAPVHSAGSGTLESHANKTRTMAPRTEKRCLFVLFWYFFFNNAGTRSVQHYDEISIFQPVNIYGDDPVPTRSSVRQTRVDSDLNRAGLSILNNAIRRGNITRNSGLFHASSSRPRLTFEWNLIFLLCYITLILNCDFMNDYI